MSQSKPRLRKIIVDGDAYLWKFNPRYEKDEHGQWRCHDIFVAYTEHDKRSPLQVHFVTWESPIDGGPLHSGAPINLKKPDTGGINLHQPKFAAEIIRQGLVRGWKVSGNKPLVIENGIELLAEIGYQVE